MTTERSPADGWLQRTVFRWIGWMWTTLGGWPGRLAVAGCVAIACAFFLLVGLMLWKGGTWAYLVYAEDPYAHFGGGLLFLWAAWIVARGYRSPWRDWLPVLGKGVMLVLSFALSFAAGELLLRTALIRQQEAQSLDRLRELRKSGKQLRVRSTHPMAHIIQPSDNSRQVFELQPHLEMEFGHKLLKTNSDGMREDRDYPRERAPHSVRIVGIGDSGMFGWNVEQGEDYMAVLETLLNARGDGVTYDVLNLAAPGYNTQLEVERLRSLGLQFDPDIVVVGWCENDYQLPFFMLEKENFRRRDISYLHEFLFNRDSFADLVAGVRMRDHRSYDKDRVVEELKEGSGSDGVRQAFQDLRKLSDEHGFRTLVFGPMRTNELALCREAGLPVYNINEKIARDAYPPEWAAHFMHPRPEGHRLLAEHIAADLDARGWLVPRDAMATRASPAQRNPP